MLEHRILIVDDEKLIRWSLSTTLKKEGYNIEEAATGREAREKLRSFNPHLILLDIWLPDCDGLALLKEFKAEDSNLSVLMVTANAQSNYIVDALQHGADDYIGKPFKLEMVSTKVQQIFQEKISLQTNPADHTLADSIDHDQMVGNSPLMVEVLKKINCCAKSECKTVLILGESGTGKELVAQAIHEHSSRHEAPFIELNCAAIPENLLENELFGHAKGAYTDASTEEKGIFESAHLGTVFLDEIGELPPAMQAKILKVIETKRFRRLGGKEERTSDVRIVAATNRNLVQMVEEGNFRGDLFFRLNVMAINLPALRERIEDIPNLIQYFIARLNQEYHKQIVGVSTEGLDCLMRYDWPGNVRELRNTIERAVMIETGSIITPTCPNCEDQHRDTPMIQNSSPLEFPSPFTTTSNISPSQLTPSDQGFSMEDFEIKLISQALSWHNGNQTEAAKHLGISRDTIRYRMKKFNLDELVKKIKKGDRLHLGDPTELTRFSH